MTATSRTLTWSIAAFAAASVLLTGCSSDSTDSTSSSETTAAATATATSDAAGQSPADTPDAEFTLAEVAEHNSSGDCWTAIDGKVYDLTEWEDRHPGGEARIRSLCGIDGTSQFTAQHGGQSRPTNTLEGFQIGTLAAS